MRRASTIALALVTASTTAFALARAPHWMGSIAGKDGAKITGSAMMMAGKEANTTEVTMELKGDAAGVTRPWHVHIGSCAKSGGVFGGGRSYTPVAIDDKGNGKSVATLAVAVPDTGSYYVNVHESAQNMAKIVACGDLKAM